MLNTFFFGYLSPKWKRLARVISLLPTPILIHLGWDNSIDVIVIGNEPENASILVAIWFVIVAIISYTLKPFVVK
tara:strand:+ start:294 stop:518 length:225 start_codon:yes stop_codon:yes gene_type:complete